MLQDTNNPIAVVRESWIYLNIREDEREHNETRKAEIEYGGLFSGPEVYMKVKGIEPNKKEASPTSTGGFQIIRDTSPFDERMKLAVAGETVIHDPRPDIAEAVALKRREADEQEQVQDPRIHQYPEDPKYDTLVIERKPRPDGE